MHSLVCRIVRRPRAATAAGIALIVIAAAVAGAAGYFGTQTAHPPARVATQKPAPSSKELRAAGAHPPAAPPPPPSNIGTGAASTAALRRALGTLVTARALGGEVRIHVADLSAGAPSGAVLYDRGGAVPAPPASAAKLLTAAALLQVRRPADRITTTVRTTGTPGTVVLVGAGDPTLSGAAAGQPTRYAGAARLSDLASALRARGVPVRRLLVDGSLFSGPGVLPGWAAEDVPSSYGAPITAVLADGARDEPSAVRRSAVPDLAAGRLLARLLGRPTLPVMRAPAAVRPGAVLAQVRSAPLGELILEMLHTSDNVLAECLGRQVALAAARPASFAGATSAIRFVLSRAHLLVGTGMQDASGLARADRVSATTLTDVLRAAVRVARLRPLLTALPVAGWSGTLAGRYRARSEVAADGAVRAKTGTLTGVSVLAGVVHAADGHLLVFAAIADRAPATAPAESALDAIAVRLART